MLLEKKNIPPVKTESPFETIRKNTPPFRDHYSSTCPLNSFRLTDSCAVCRMLPRLQHYSVYQILKCLNEKLPAMKPFLVKYKYIDTVSTNFYLLYFQRIAIRPTCFDGSWSSSGTIHYRNKNTH